MNPIYKLYRFIWPPKLRRWIGDSLLIFAVWTMARAGANDEAVGVSVVIAYDLLDPDRESPDDLFTPLQWHDTFSWYVLIIAVKVLMIRNLSRDAIIHRAGLAYTRLIEVSTNDKTPQT